MSEIHFEDPWKPRRWPWQRRGSLVELSQRWVFLIVGVNLAMLIWLGINWKINSDNLDKQDGQITSLGDEIDWLTERSEWGRSYARTKLAVESVASGKMSPSQLRLLTETLWSQSRTYTFDPLLIVAVMQLESRSNPYARGRLQSGTASGAMGLMQLKFGTAKMMGRTLGLEIHTDADLMKPDVNLLLGSFYLLRQIIRYGDVSHGLMAYNIGPGELAKRLRTGESLPLAYSRSILIEYQRLVKEFGPS